jgi:hypothetical protein
MEIPLRNKNGEIIDMVIVSNVDYQDLNQFKWYKCNKYAKTTIEKKIGQCIDTYLKK